MNNSKGFSLVELMVVVAIIAILSSFAIPTYSNFQAKSRQKEAQTLLASFFTSAKSTEAETGWFPGNFEATGYKPAGNIHYRITAADGTNPIAGPNNDTCITTTGAVCSAGFATWTEVTTGSFAAAAVNTCTVATTNTTFNVCASANIRTGAGTDTDTWLLNESKSITNTNDGIN